METIKLIHILCAYITGLGFFLRGSIFIFNEHLPSSHLWKMLPHIIDTVLLISGLTMAIILSISPAKEPWLIAKIIGLFCYIGFGLLMLRWGSSSFKRIVGLIGGLLCYIWIIGAAHTKSPWSFISIY